jgi:hypothetical protein
MGGKRDKIQFEYVDFLENTLLHTEVRQIRENMAQIELMLQKAYTFQTGTSSYLFSSEKTLKYTT